MDDILSEPLSPPAQPPGAGKPGLALSPLAKPFPEIGEVAGVKLAAASGGFYQHKRDDVVLLRFDGATACAGVFTDHAVGSAPVDWCREVLRRTGGRARALVVNAGCANAMTGLAGMSACRTVANATAVELGCTEDEVLLASTGVIGVVLEAGRVLNALQPALASLSLDGWERATRAVMTTDTFPKGSVRGCEVEGRPVRIAGFAKGSGMIAPDMATMLGFVVTDAAVAPAALHAMLVDATVRTFNAVTVDGDRSTNDTCLLFATGRAGGEWIADAADPRLTAFRAALEAVLLDLAQMLVRDGEGASKFVRVEVTGAQSDRSAAKIARTICESPLVKTALAGEDANWGRVAAAAGRAGEPLDRERLSIRFGEHWAARDGAVSPDYDEAAMSAYMRRPELEVAVDVGVGSGRAVMWTCDLTHGYVSINGDYRS